MPQTPSPAEFLIPAICPICPICQTGEALVRQWTFKDVTVLVQPCPACVAVDCGEVVKLPMSWACRAVKPDVTHRHRDGLVVFA